MYDVDENGHISLEEMTKFVLEIYHMMGDSFESREDLEDEAKNIFRIMDVDMDGKVSQEEFVKVLQNNKELVDLLTLTDV
jgi:Ca2+-binding EF-hand superfamily protein